MARYAKLVNGNLVFAKNSIEVDGMSIFSPLPETLVANGYKEYIAGSIDTTMEKTCDVKSHYEESSKKIVQVYEYTINQVKAQKYFTDVIQQYMDDKVAELGYDNVFTCISYINSTNPKFKAEAQSVLEWRDAVWAKGFELLDSVTSSEQITIPSKESVIGMLPELVWGTVEVAVEE